MAERSPSSVIEGWDPSPGIVSVWADWTGQAFVWRRAPGTREIVRESVRFRPWILTDDLPSALALRRSTSTPMSYRTLGGDGALRYLVHADDGRVLRPLGARGKEHVLLLTPEEQYLVQSGRTYFRDLLFDDLRRLQFDLETTGLDRTRDRIFLIAVRLPEGDVRLLEATALTDAAEADLIRRLVATVAAADPDVIENHNLHGFDLPFLARRARALGVSLSLGRLPLPLTQRAARRGIVSDDPGRPRRVRFVAPGRELIDTMDGVMRYGFSTGDLQWRGLKAVARHFGIAREDRELIPGDRIFDVYRRDPDRVRRYATADVEEVADLSRILSGAAFALARMAPRRYERLADAGAATGVIDPVIVRAYLRAGRALPAHREGRDVPHTGAALHLFATGVAHRVVKADVASLYPSLMRTYRIGPARDSLNVLLALVDELVDERLTAKRRARSAPPGSRERHAHEAMSAAMKLVVNSAYGYLAAGGGLTRFADVDAANEVTRRGRDLLALLCRELAARGVTLLEADTDGVYFSVPAGWVEADERRVVADVGALLPPLVQLEFEGRYRAMLSHEPKNYVLARYDGTLVLKGVAFRSSRAEPFGEAFLKQAVAALLDGNVAGVRDCYTAAVKALRSRELSTYDVSSRVRLTRSPERYLALRQSRRELPYEALLAAGRTRWTVGERVRVYRTECGGGLAAVGEEDDDRPDGGGEPRDYDVEHYVRVLREQFAGRLSRSLTPDAFLAVVADPDVPSLFDAPLEGAVPILTRLPASAIEA